MGLYRRDSSSILSGTCWTPSVAAGSKKIQLCGPEQTMITERDGTDTRSRLVNGDRDDPAGRRDEVRPASKQPSAYRFAAEGSDPLLGLLPLQLDPLLQVQRIARTTDVVEVFDRVRHARRVVQAPVRRSKQDSRAHVSIGCNVELPQQPAR